MAEGFGDLQTLSEGIMGIELNLDDDEEIDGEDEKLIQRTTQMVQDEYNSILDKIDQLDNFLAMEDNESSSPTSTPAPVVKNQNFMLSQSEVIISKSKELTGLKIERPEFQDNNFWRNDNIVSKLDIEDLIKQLE